MLSCTVRDITVHVEMLDPAIFFCARWVRRSDDVVLGLFGIALPAAFRL